MSTFKKENTNIVKGFAIILLLVYHLFESQYVTAARGVDFRPFPQELFFLFARFGNICVSVFVFMTSFGIAKGFFGRDGITIQDICEKTVKRFRILMGNFFLLYLSVNILWWKHLDYAAVYGSGKKAVINALLDATGIYGFFDVATINVTWWYMKIAYSLIFLVPIFCFAIKKIGYPILLVTFFMMNIFLFNGEITRFLLIAVFGVCAAYGEWLDKLINYKRYIWAKWIIALPIYPVIVFIRQNEVVQEKYLYLADVFVAFYIVYLAGVLFASIPVLSKVLHFIGKYSMNIFLVHTFFYNIIWSDFIYSFKYAGLIFLILLLVSLAYSVALECVKKLLKLLWNKRGYVGSRRLRNN